MVYEFLFYEIQIKYKQRFTEVSQREDKTTSEFQFLNNEIIYSLLILSAQAGRLEGESEHAQWE